MKLLSLLQILPFAKSAAAFGAEKVTEAFSSKPTTATTTLHSSLIDSFNQLFDDDGYLRCGKQGKAVLMAIFLTVFGLVVLSFDNERTEPGTTVVRSKIFGIEQRYFLVYYNGLLAYIFMMYGSDYDSGQNINVEG